jgi:hypothetical protein
MVPGQYHVVDVSTPVNCWVYDKTESCRVIETSIQQLFFNLCWMVALPQLETETSDYIEILRNKHNYDWKSLVTMQPQVARTLDDLLKSMNQMFEIMYRAGVNKGADLLSSLANGEIKPGDFYKQIGGKQ